MCSWFNDEMKEDEEWIDYIWISVEACFCLSGYINAKNNIYWGDAMVFALG